MSDELTWDDDGRRALRLVRSADGTDSDRQRAVTDGLYRHHRRAAGVVYECIVSLVELAEDDEITLTDDARVLLSTALEECNQLADEAKRHDETLARWSPAELRGIATTLAGASRELSQAADRLAP